MSANAERVLVEFEVASEQGNERIVMEKVAAALDEVVVDLPTRERLKTAVAEATMNAIEHGNQGNAELPVSVRVVTRNSDLAVQITDQGAAADLPDAPVPDIEAKLAGLQSPRGWGLFLIKNMVDDMHVSGDESHHTVELILHLRGGKHANRL